MQFSIDWHDFWQLHYNVTLGTLESLLCVQLVIFSLKALKYLAVSIRCWTESVVAFCWVQGRTSKWKQFLANRVWEIQDPPTK